MSDNKTIELANHLPGGAQGYLNQKTCPFVTVIAPGASGTPEMAGMECLGSTCRFYAKDTGTCHIEGIVVRQFELTQKLDDIDSKLDQMMGRSPEDEVEG